MTNEATSNRSVGKRIKVARIAKGYSLQSVSGLTEIDEPTLGRIESGKTRFPLDTLKRVHKVVGTNLDFLVYGTITTEDSKEMKNISLVSKILVNPDNDEAIAALCKIININEKEQEK